MSCKECPTAPLPSHQDVLLRGGHRLRPITPPLPRPRDSQTPSWAVLGLGVRSGVKAPPGRPPTFTVPSTSTNQRLNMAWIWPSVSSGLALWIFFLTRSSSNSRLSRQ